MAYRNRYSDAELALETLKLELERHLRKVVCPVHGEHPKRVTVYGTSVYDMSFKVDGCCDELGCFVTIECCSEKGRFCGL